RTIGRGTSVSVCAGVGSGKVRVFQADATCPQSRGGLHGDLGVVLLLVQEPHTGEVFHHAAEHAGGGVRVQAGVGQAFLLEASDACADPVHEQAPNLQVDVVEVGMTRCDLLDDVHDAGVV